VTVITLVIGLQFVFVATPWPQTYTAVYAAFFGVFGESASSIAIIGGTISFCSASRGA
jgi:uncharacterized membrane protein